MRTNIERTRWRDLYPRNISGTVVHWGVLHMRVNFPVRISFPVQCQIRPRLPSCTWLKGPVLAYLKRPWFQTKLGMYRNIFTASNVALDLEVFSSFFLVKTNIESGNILIPQARGSSWAERKLATEERRPLKLGAGWSYPMRNCRQFCFYSKSQIVVVAYWPPEFYQPKQENFTYFSDLHCRQFSDILPIL